MKLAERKGIAGMINHTHEGFAGGYGVNNFKEAATHATAIELPFVNVDVTLENASQIRAGGPITATHWDGTTLSSVSIPSKNLKVVYDYTELDTDGYKEMIKALTDTGKKFINGPITKQIGNDKQLSQELFDELCIRTPVTMAYSRDNANALLGQSGFIFIKDVAGTMGQGQVTISSKGKSIIAKIDGAETSFISIPDALKFAEANVNASSCIVQEGIIVPKIEGRVWDLRAVFQKNGEGELVMPVVFVRIGVKGRDQSNIAQGGNSQDPEVFFPNFTEVRSRLISVGTKVFNGLQRKSDDVGEMGMDFIISTDGEPILIEINPTPAKRVQGPYKATGWDAGGLDMKLTMRKDVENIPTEEQVREKWRSTMVDWMRNPLSYAKYFIESHS